jgi:acetoin utilization deacetylase AcuC-like enzyme
MSDIMLPFSLVYREGFYLPFGNAHVFPGLKYKLIRERLLETRVAHPGDFVPAEPIALEDVLRVHEAGFVDRLVHGKLAAAEISRMELPYSKALVEATLLGCGGTLQAARLALANGIAISIGGGFHHAHPDHGEGFCMLHDVAIALRRLLAEGTIRRAMVIDLDVHQGNGTAAIFPPAPNGAPSAPEVRAIEKQLAPGQICSEMWGEMEGSCTPSEDGVFTISLHQRDNYPLYKPPSSIDVHLEDGTNDVAYLDALERALNLGFACFRPDLIAFVAGADPYFDDQLGGLSLTLEGLMERDRTVFRAAQTAGVPIFSVYAGGYARKLEDTVTIHSNTVLAAAEVFSFHGATSC